ncbi:hypothetical protein PVBG_05958 [Plasmodium vivax Brazil I]|uniref:Variable surface protein n=1 Tax=Plasmodium vivax (strain Brazil I) TaxID=1033975 RepID=A0A0J9T0F9_PLAV1|nr:hypothetical protein PVBG_05958 [Plasmodium vivax Brazil I]
MMMWYNNYIHLYLSFYLLLYNFLIYCFFFVLHYLIDIIIIFYFYQYPLYKLLEIKYKPDIIFNMSFNRLLAKHTVQKELKYQQFRETNSDNVMNKKNKNISDNTSHYSQLKKVALHDFDEYKKGYKNRYSKKRGLAKLDCYFEKKVFDNFDYIYELSEKRKNNKKTFIKKILSKYRYLIIIFFLLPIPGSIMPFLFGGGKDAYIPMCRSTCDKHTAGSNDAYIAISYGKVPSDIFWETMDYLSMILFYLAIIIIVVMLVYTLIKLRKYWKMRSNCDEYIDKEYNAYRTFDIIFPRLLAKHIQEKNLHNTSLRQNILDHGKGTKVKNLEDRLTYSKIKMNESSNIDTYMKGYKSRYEKKKGLYKLDCYCEKKLFDKFDF